MKEDNARYDICLYRSGTLIQIIRDISFREAFDIYHKYDPFTQVCVDVYRNKDRLTFGEAMDKFSDPHLFVKLF